MEKSTPEVAAPSNPLAPVGGNLKFPLLDGLRAVAAVSVLCYHWVAITHRGGVLGKLLGHGDIGVVIFFLLSGFVIYRPFVAARHSGKPQPSIRRFYLRRAARIIPAYWVALTVIQLWTGVAGFHSRWWQLYLFGQIYSPRLVFGGGIGPAWSLCVEVSFYLLLPLYALCMSRVLARVARTAAVEIAVLVVLAIGAMGIHALIARTGADANLSFTLPGTFYLFAAGMILAIVSVHTALLERLYRFGDLAWLGGLALYVVIALSIPAVKLGSVNPLYVPTAVLLLLPAVARPIGQKRLWSARLLLARPVPTLGLISYAFYLWHQVLIVELARAVSEPAAVLALSLAAAFAVAYASYRVVEEPSLRWASRAMR
jgi:peptidoglycan/LPS O-acetylase OafA/YrhL